jgi:TRAP-type C4-dicarboxylate transport system permease small subunit
MTPAVPDHSHAETPTLRFLRAVDRAVLRVMWALRVVAGLVIVATMLATVYDVVMRYVFAQPTEWALTLSTAGVLVATFFAMPHMVAVREHIDMDLVYRRLGTRARLVANAVTGVATLLFGAGMAWLGYRAAITSYVGGLVTSGNFALPLWALYATVYVGGLGLVLVVVLSPWRLRGADDAASPEETFDGGELA